MATRWARASAALPAAVVATLAALLALLATVWSPAPADAEPGDRTVVLVGVPGLRWDDAEHLGGFLDSVDDLAAGSLVVRSTTAVACPADGWLAISAGNRAAGGCDNPREPVDGAIPGWDGYLAAADDASFGAEPGLLGDVLAEAGVTTTAIGPRAAVALATSDGTVADSRSYLPSTLTQDVADAVERSDLVVVD